MPEKHLHIVTHNVPWPADFGGVVDLFYKIKTLHQFGIKIHLHCFTYGNHQPQEELNQYCEDVSYYKRKKSITRFSLRLPFIVFSRKSEELITNLIKDNYPVLLEGIHTSYYLFTGALKNRNVILRLHNVEFEYYHHLALHEKKIFKKMYFNHESMVLKKYESEISKKALIIAVSQEDSNLYQQWFHAPQIQYLPVFLPHTSVNAREGRGTYCLYHGNLSVNENEEAAIWLIENIFSKTDIPFLIAGKNASGKLKTVIEKYKNIQIIDSPDEPTMQKLVADAQIHVLPSLNNTGVKLKLINALFNGRHCLANNAGVKGSELESLCHIAENADSFRKKVNHLFQLDFTKEEIDRRKILLSQLFDNQSNAKKLIQLFWNES